MCGAIDNEARPFGSTLLDVNGVDTPALIVDIDNLEANIKQIAQVCKQHGVGWRPHVKGIKTPKLVDRLLSAGAIGVTCAKLGEAEIMANAGVRDILIANQIVGPIKISRLMRLLERCDVIVAVDNATNVSALADAAAAAHNRLRVAIEVDIGIGRAGVNSIEECRALAEQAHARPSLMLVGVMGWEGHAAKMRNPADKESAVADAVQHLVACADACRTTGAPCTIVSCGGTGTYWLSAAQKGVTEIQAGGGVFCDVHYRKHFGVEHPYALYVLSSVTSRPSRRRIICDAGKKAVSGDLALPLPVGLNHVESISLSAEHLKIELTQPNDDLQPGDRLAFVVGYSDTTVFLHDTMYVANRGVIEDAWPITARGSTR